MAMTFRQIVMKTDKWRRANAKFVRIKKFEMRRDKGMKYPFAICWSSSSKSIDRKGNVVPASGEVYLTMVEFYNAKLHCKVSCSCADFKFTHETSLHQRDAAELDYSNGEMPVIRNPDLVPSTCKHLVALYNRMEPQLNKFLAKQKSKK